MDAWADRRRRASRMSRGVLHLVGRGSRTLQTFSGAERIDRRFDWLGLRPRRAVIYRRAANR
jgi:hypothetical protein